MELPFTLQSDVERTREAKMEVERDRDDFMTFNVRVKRKRKLEPQQDAFIDFRHLWRLRIGVLFGISVAVVDRFPDVIVDECIKVIQLLTCEGPYFRE